MSGSCAVPLCLPNNCKWDDQTGEYSKDGEDRESLYVVDRALERLRTIKGTHLTHTTINIKTELLGELFR